MNDTPIQLHPDDYKELLAHEKRVKPAFFVGAVLGAVVVIAVVFLNSFLKQAEYAFACNNLSASSKCYRVELNRGYGGIESISFPYTGTEYFSNCVPSEELDLTCYGDDATWELYLQR